MKTDYAEFLMISDDDCVDTTTLAQAKKEAEKHLLSNKELDDVRIYKLVTIASREIKYT